MRLLVDGCRLMVGRGRDAIRRGGGFTPFHLGFVLGALFGLAYGVLFLVVG